MPSRRHHALAAVVAAATAAVLAGCGSSSSTSSTSPPFANAKPLRPPASHRVKHHIHKRHRLVGLTPIGASKHVEAGDTQLEVTIRRLIDPLRGSGASLPSKTHAVGVLVQIRNAGSGVYDSSATGDISVVPSSGTAPPVFAPQGTCQTQLRDFDNYISSGETRDGCVVFAVPNGTTVREVRFSPHAGAAGRATWRPAH